MGKTYRDIRRAKYRQFVERWFPEVELDCGLVGNFDLYHDQYPRDLLVEQGEMFNKSGLEHVCSPYCLIHWAKRVDRRKARQKGKRWLKAERWREAERAGD